MLLGAFLVFGMQAGFVLEAGFCRNRETVNVLVECMFDTSAGCCTGAGDLPSCSAGNPFIGNLPGDHN